MFVVFKVGVANRQVFAIDINNCNDTTVENLSKISNYSKSVYVQSKKLFVVTNFICSKVML